MIKGFAAALLPLFLLGCNEETNSVSYYEKDFSARANKIAECRNNPGELKDTPNCINALEAQKEADRLARSYRDIVEGRR